jgi:NAD+ kinase
MKIGIIANLKKTEAAKFLKRLVKKLLSLKIKIYLQKDTAAKINRKSLACSVPDILKNSEIIISFGGDGTLLKTARLVGDKNIPVLGINLGNLGFLTEIEQKHAIPEIKKLIKKKNISTKNRMVLKVKHYRNKKLISKLFGLNDVVISKGALSRILHINTYLDKKLLNAYHADGLIVSTNSGSTGHSLSSGGPIIHPELEAFIINPICSHALSNRPIVLPAQSTIGIKLISAEKEISLTIDGQIGSEIKTNDYIEIEKASHAIKLIKCGKKDFFKTTREKLGWSGKITVKK